MKSTNWKTSLFGWLSAGLLALSIPSSPIYPLVPDSVHQVAGIGVLLTTGMLGQKAQDKPETKEAPKPTN